MTRRRVRRGPLLAVAIVLAAAVAIGGYKYGLFGAASPPPGVTLTDLHSVAQLRSLFDAGAGTPRLVLIMSPT